MRKGKWFREPIVKNILWALAVMIFGFILWNITFLFDFFFQNVIDGIIRLFMQADFNMTWNWFPLVKHFSFMIVICLISWPIFKSRLGTLYKAIYSTVPLGVVFATIGILFYQWPVLVYLLSTIFGIGVLCYLYRTKQSWIYYYTVIFVGSTLAIFTLLGGEI